MEYQEAKRPMKVDRAVLPQFQELLTIQINYLKKVEGRFQTEELEVSAIKGRLIELVEFLMDYLDEEDIRKCIQGRVHSGEQLPGKNKLEQVADTSALTGSTRTDHLLEKLLAKIDNIQNIQTQKDEPVPQELPRPQAKPNKQEKQQKKQRQKQDALQKQEELKKEEQKKSQMPSPIDFSQDDQDTAQMMKNGIYDQSLIHSSYQFDVHTLHTRAIVHNDKMFVQKDNLKECQVLRHDNLVQLGTINTEEMVIFCSCVVGTSLFLGLSDKVNKNFIRAYDIKTYKMLKSNPLQFQARCLLHIGNNELLCAGSSGTVQVIQTTDLTLIKTSQLISKELLIHSITKTMNNNEYAIAPEKGGIRFISLDPQNQFEMTKSEEVYFPNKWVRSLQFYDKEMIVACVAGNTHIFLICRSKKKVVAKIENPTGNNHIQYLELVPHFDVDSLPFVIVRDQVGLSLLNVRNKCPYRIYNAPHEVNAAACFFNEVVNRDNHKEMLIVLKEHRKESKKTSLNMLKFSQAFFKGLYCLNYIEQ